jgi:hypothetical protein
MRRLVALLLPAAAGAALLHGWAERRPDPRTPETRTHLAREPSAKHAVWVFFDPRTARGQGEPALTPDALRGRAASALPIFDNDSPIPEHLITRVLQTGARLRHSSRWLRAVSVEADSATAARLARLKEVHRIRLVGNLHMAAHESAAHPRAHVLPHSTQPRLPEQAQDSTFYGANWTALNALGVPTAHRFGFTGKNVRIAILDTGFQPAHQSLFTRQVGSAYDFINGDVIVSNQGSEGGAVDPERHGTHVWSLLGARAPGTLVGPAYDAQFLLAKVDLELGDTRADEDRWVAAVEWADSLGARIIQSSVVFRFDFTDRLPISYAELNGDSTVTTKMAVEAAKRGILVVTAIGDNGPAPGTLSAPADADGILAVGATDLASQPASFSSRGPTADGRLKPELVARGVGMLAALSTNLDGYEASLSGTSLSSPLIAGSAALIMEAWPMLDGAAVRNALILSATRARSPDNTIGFGLPDVGAALLFPAGVIAATATPIDLDGNLTTIAPEFTWSVPYVHTTAGSVLYTVEVGRDSLFRNIVFMDTVRDVTSYASRAALKPASFMWWRVRAQAAQGVQFVSPPARPFTMPGWVRLIAPDPTAATFVETPRPNLTWTPLTAPPPVGPLVYDVEIVSAAGQLVQPTIRNVTSSVVRVPQPLTPNQPYRWRVIARTQLGSADTVESASTFVVNVTERPPITLLQQNFPNPFPRPDLGTRETRIWFDLADATTVDLAVFDLRGRLVKRLVPASPACGTITLPPGIYGRTGVLVTPDPCVLTTWDGTDYEGRTVVAGVYVLRLRTNGQDQFRHMVFAPR